MVAVDPALIGHGQLVYLWPNPFGWRGPFLAADTGGAIQGRRIDFYDWRGRAHPARLGPADRPSQPHAARPRHRRRAGRARRSRTARAPASGPLGARIGRLARAQLGRGPSIPGFQPPSVGYAWCAWFATNIWRNAGVPIPVNAWSGYPYDWAHARGQLFKRVGRPPEGATPPAGVGADVRHQPAPARPGTSTSSTASCPTGRSWSPAATRTARASPATAPAACSAPTPPT